MLAGLTGSRAVEQALLRQGAAAVSLQAEYVRREPGSRTPGIDYAGLWIVPALMSAIGRGAGDRHAGGRSRRPRALAWRFRERVRGRPRGRAPRAVEHRRLDDHRREPRVLDDPGRAHARVLAAGPAADQALHARPHQPGRARHVHRHFVYALLILQTVTRRAEPSVPHARSPGSGAHAGEPRLAGLFIHHVADSIQADTVIAEVMATSTTPSITCIRGSRGRACIPATRPASGRPAGRSAAAIPAPKEGYVQAIGTHALLRLAREHDLVVELARPGDFVIAGRP